VRHSQRPITATAPRAGIAQPNNAAGIKVLSAKKEPREKEQRMTMHEWVIVAADLMLVAIIWTYAEI
jgi:hypothetical protein